MADKSKIIFMNTVLKNPVLGKRLVEAWDSPIGSTKRSQARDMLSSIRKTTANKFDGQGGVGTDIMSGANSFIDPFKKLLEAPEAQASTNVEKPAPAFSLSSSPSPAPSSEQVPGASKQAVSNLWGGIKGVTKSVVTGVGDRFQTLSNDASYRKPETWLNPQQVQGLKKYQEYIVSQGNKSDLFGDVDKNIKKPSDFGLPLEYDMAAAKSLKPYDRYSIDAEITKLFLKKGEEKDASDKKNAEAKKNAGAQTGPVTPGGKSIYYKGADIYDATTNTRVGSTAWKDPNQWNSGKGVKVVAAPAGGTVSDVPAENVIYNTVAEATAALKPGQKALLKNGQYIYINRGDGSAHIGNVGEPYTDPTPPTEDKSAESVVYNTADEAIAKLKPGQKALLKVVPGKTQQYVYISPDGSVRIGNVADNWEDPSNPSSSGANGTDGTTGADSTGSTSGLTGLKGATGLDTGIEQAEIQKLLDNGYTPDQIADYFQDKNGGVSKAQRLIDLDALLEKNNGLDKLAEQKKEMVGRQGTITEDLQDYIDGRDSYIEDANVAIETMKKELLKTSDPTTRSIITKQLDMLYLMKGRQSQRYTDLVNTGITRLNQEMTNLDATIAAAQAKYSKELTQQGAKTEEDYDRERRDLIALATEIMNYPTKIEAAYSEKRKSDLEKINLAKAAIELKKLGGGTTGVDSSEFDKEIKAIMDNQYISYKDDAAKEDFLLKDGSLSTFYDIIMKQGKSPQVARQAVSQAFANKMRTLVAAGDLAGIKKMNAQVAELYTNQEEANKVSALLGLTPDEFLSMAMSDFGAISSATSTIVRSTVGLKSAEIRAALNDLIGKGLFNNIEKPNSASAKTSWMKRNSEKLGPDLANTIWDIWTFNYPQNAAKPARIFAPASAPDKKVNDLTDDELTEVIGALTNTYISGQLAI